MLVRLRRDVREAPAEERAVGHRWLIGPRRR
jgi:hypothetical protein